MIKKIFLIALTVCLLGSCSECNTNSDNGFVALSVAGATVDNGEQVSTRATGGTPLTNGAIGISRIANSNYGAQNNYKYICNNGVWKEDDSANKILLGSESASLFAHIPYSSSIDINNIPLTSCKYSDGSDFCYDYKTGMNVTNTSATGVHFELQHAYAKLTLRFSQNSSFQGAGDVRKITITGAASSASLNLSSGSPSISGVNTGAVVLSDGTTIIFNVKSNASDVDLLMVPSTLASGLTFTINVDGTDKTANLPAATLGELVAGTHYIIPIGISSGSTLDLGSTDVTITDWTTPDVISTSPKLPQPESNCYIVAPNSTIYIPVSRANKGNPANFPSGASFTTGLLWSDVSATHVTANAVFRCIKVTAGATPGNSVVYAKNAAGDIVWSWHIWVTNYTPGLTSNTGINTTTYQTANGLLWMDRNLGATTTTPATQTTKGLLYQWGRKDPFPGSTTYNGTIESTLFGEKNAVNKVAVALDSNLVNSIQNPLTFYFNTSSPFDWYSNTDTQNDALWYDGTSTKTIYDPCPSGWRVPYTDTTSPWNDFTAGTWNSGYSWTGTPDTGYYPASGYRNSDDGTLNDVCSYGYYWSASVLGPIAYDLHFTSDGVYPSYANGRANGFSVRCVKN